MKTENNIKEWSVLGKGYTHKLNNNASNYQYTYIVKTFTGTREEFDIFCSSLYDTIECWKEIESGEVKPKKQKEVEEKEIVYYKTPKPKKKLTWEDSFKKKKPKYDKWGMKLKY